MSRVSAHTIERVRQLVREAIPHHDIARRLGKSNSAVQAALRRLRMQGGVPTHMRGPWVRVAGVDWKAAASIWHDLKIPTADAVKRIGAAERTIYRRLGNRVPDVHHNVPENQRDAISAPKQIVVPMATNIFKQPRGFSMMAMRGPDPFREVKEQQVIAARRASI